MEITPEGITEEQKAVLVQVARDPLLFFRANLKIADKMGRIVPLKLNRQQLALHKEIIRQEQAGQPVRIIILKARQLGFSTATEAELYYRTVMRKNVHTMIVAHKADASTNIFDKVKLFYEHSHPMLRPDRKLSNAKEMLFENPSSNLMDRRSNPGLRSKIEIETAFNKEVGRSSTIQYVHASEMAFWPHPKETMLALSQSVPNLPGTIIIIESTANGVGGEFYEMWQKAVAGENGYTPMFFPWCDCEEYRMPARDFLPTDEEREVQELHGLSLEQLAWRRWCIASNCGGDIEQFHQEYPITPEEAFIASGRPVFDTRALDRAMKQTIQPKTVGRVMESAGRVVYQSMPRGYLQVWEPPQDGEEYVIGIDIALGKSTSDYSCMQVLKRRTKEQAAVWHGHIDPDELGREASFLGRYYNLALLVPEANSMGAATIASLRRWRYPRVYRRTTTGKVEERTTSDYGFWTGPQTKSMAISGLARYIREDAARIKDPGTIRECLTYVYDDAGRANAQEGCYDDRVMALALALVHCDSRDYAVSVPDLQETPLEQLYTGLNATTGY